MLGGFAIFVIGSFAEDLRGFAAMTGGATKVVTTSLAYLVPNFAALNVITQVAHGAAVPERLIVLNSIYVFVYAGALTSAAILVFERRNLK